MDIFSGDTIAIRLGTKSANSIKNPVINRKDITSPINLEFDESAGIYPWIKLSIYGAAIPSPTIPANIDTAFVPICTAVKKSPDARCIFITFKAFLLPSSAITCNFNFLAEARDISLIERNIQIPINIIIKKILIPILILLSFSNKI